MLPRVPNLVIIKTVLDAKRERLLKMGERKIRNSSTICSSKSMIILVSILNIYF